ncbi:hypothetical protein QTJ16_001351 [Diplocarpon rosae]|uniref:Glycosyltransferase 2-like domain-containing protein n=1 Tax=Diplocarpon rosae TaxID=946125 RepID=A0AAD9T6K5_9HELO|nr:hypothetical protein QTJ16_001351 [Diplocarpon rosae]
MISNPALRPSRLWLNSLGGLLLYLFMFFFVRRAAFNLLPLTLDTVWQVLLTDVSRQRSSRMLRRLRERLADLRAGQTSELLMKEKSESFQWRRGRENLAGVPYLVSIVGYREEEDLFRQALQSYRLSCTGLTTMLVSVDGDAALDLDMVATVQKVYPHAKLIALGEPFSKMAQRLAELSAFGPSYCPPASEHDRLDDFNCLPLPVREEAEALAMNQVIRDAHRILEANGAFDDDGGDAEIPFQVLCFYQPHAGKKDVLFTNAILSMVMKSTLGVDYVWTSDSDTLVLEDTVDKTIGCMALDPGAGGSCTSLGVHNGDETLVAALTGAAYWSELAYCRGQSGAVGATDCQPGPCAAFKIEALSEIIFKWYMQTMLGRKTVVNDDRHLTTCLLLKNWRVTFNTNVMTLTDTPTTATALLIQQLRWSRATYMETIAYPMVYAIHGPISFYCGVNRVYGPIGTAVLVLRYAVTGKSAWCVSLLDVGLRLFISATYNLCFLPRHRNSHGVLWTLLAVISQFFYQIPLPGIGLWSCFTLMQGSWGTQMRSQQQKAAEERHLGRENLWTILAISAWLGVVAAALARCFAATFYPGAQGFCAAYTGGLATLCIAWSFLRR